MLLTGNTESAKWRYVAYVQDLRPDPSIDFFFGGYRSVTRENENNPNVGWIDNEWNALRANMAYQNRDSRAFD